METIISEDLRPRSVDVPGGNPVTFSIDDFTSREAWFDLLAGREIFQSDFCVEDTWRRYDYLSMGLTEGVVSDTGLERSGKTLWGVHTAHHLARLFNKKAVLNFHPKPEFGPYTFLDEKVFVEAWEELTKIAKKGGKPDNQKVIDALALYNAVIVIDEAHKVLHCRRGMSAYAMLLGDVIKEWGHNHNLIILLTPNVKELDKKLVLDRRTHVVTCGYQTFFEKTSSYIIYSNRHDRKVVKHIKPENWGHLWDSWNVQGMRVALTTKDGKKLKV